MRNIEVSVVDYIVPGRGRRTRYVIAVVLSTRSWTIQRRYVEFRKLYDALSTHGIGLAAVPARGLFGPRTLAALQRRVESLDIWLHGAVASWKSTTPETAEDVVSKIMTAFLCNSEEFRYANSDGPLLSRVMRFSVSGALHLLFRRSYAMQERTAPPPQQSFSPPHSAAMSRSSSVERFAATATADSSVHSTGSNKGIKSAKMYSYANANATSVNTSLHEQFLFHGAVLSQKVNEQGLPRVTVEAFGSDVCAQGFSCVSVPPSPRGRQRFKKSWSAYTDNVLKHAAKSLEMQNAVAAALVPGHSNGDDASWMDSASEGWGSEDEGAPNAQVQQQRRDWLEQELEGRDNGDSEGYDSEGWASEAANNSYDGGDSEVYGSWDEGQVWVAPRMQNDRYVGDIDDHDVNDDDDDEDDDNDDQNVDDEALDQELSRHASSEFDEFTDSELELEMELEQQAEEVDAEELNDEVASLPSNQPEVYTLGENARAVGFGTPGQTAKQQDDETSIVSSIARLFS